MTTDTLTIDKTGRVVLPKPLRDQFGLRPGSELRLTATADHITLIPVAPRAALQREGKLLVHAGKGTFDLVAEIQRGRDERTRELLGQVAR